MRLTCTTKGEEDSSLHKVTSVCSCGNSNKGIPSKLHQHGCRILSFRPPFASSVCVCPDVINANTSPLSPVGLITTSYSVRQPLRKASHIAQTKMHLPRIWLFLNCNCVTDSASSCSVLFGICSSLTVGAKPALLLSRSCSGFCKRDLFLDLSSSVGLYWGATEAFQKKVYLGEKTLKELSYFHVYFFDLGLFIFSCLNPLRPSSWSSCPIRNRKFYWVSKFSHFHSLFSLKRHERQLY